MDSPAVSRCLFVSPEYSEVLGPLTLGSHLSVNMLIYQLEKEKGICLWKVETQALDRSLTEHMQKRLKKI